jgi:hypothetical protein
MRGNPPATELLLFEVHYLYSYMYLYLCRRLFLCLCY